MIFTNVQKIICTAKEYFARPEISNSGLGTLALSPSLFRDEQEGVYARAETSAMRLGSAFDCFLLTPDEFTEGYATEPAEFEVPTTPMQHKFVNLLAEGVGEKEARERAGYKKASVTADQYKNHLGFCALAKDNGLIVLTTDEMTQISAMANAVAVDGYATQAVRDSEKQVVLVGTHEGTGIRMKCMIDMIAHEGSYIQMDDLKTTSKNRAGFFYAYRDYGYDRQGAIYGSMAGAFYSLPVHHGILAVGKDPIWCQLFDVDDHIEKGEEKAEFLLRSLDWHQRSGYWENTREYKENEGRIRL